MLSTPCATCCPLFLAALTLISLLFFVYPKYTCTKSFAFVVRQFLLPHRAMHLRSHRLICHTKLCICGSADCLATQTAIPLASSSVCNDYRHDLFSLPSPDVHNSVHSANLLTLSFILWSVLANLAHCCISNVQNWFR